MKQGVPLEIYSKLGRHTFSTSNAVDTSECVLRRDLAAWNFVRVRPR